MSVTIAAKVGVRTVLPPLGFVWKWGIPLKWQYKKEHNTGTIGDKPSTLGVVYFQTNSFRGNVHPKNDDTPGFVFGVWGYPILMPYTHWSSAITRTSRIERSPSRGKALRKRRLDRCYFAEDSDTSTVERGCKSGFWTSTSSNYYFI